MRGRYTTLLYIFTADDLIITSYSKKWAHSFRDRREHVNDCPVRAKIGRFFFWNFGGFGISLGTRHSGEFEVRNTKR